MTIAELIRVVESKKRVLRLEAKQKAIFDYTLANLIGHSIARLHSSSKTLPSIAEAYPALFTVEEVEEEAQERKDQLSALRLKQFAQSFNKRFKDKEANK